MFSMCILRLVLKDLDRVEREVKREEGECLESSLHVIFNQAPSNLDAA